MNRAGLRISIHYLLLLVVLIIAMPATADSSGKKLAAYYDRFMALCGDQAYQWDNAEVPRKSIAGVIQVGVGKNNRYALTRNGALFLLGEEPTDNMVVMDQVSAFHAGRSGLLIIRDDNSLWHVQTKDLFSFGEQRLGDPVRLADNILTASVGDSANYYVGLDGALFVYGRAHRGQYGDGKLVATKSYVQTETDVVQVVSHTGHALVLKRNGSVWGTGGNIYGPLGSHGYGDKAVRWGQIVDGVVAIATGSSHSLAIKRDNSLWVWGRNEGLVPKQVLTQVIAVAGGNNSSIALSNGILWQWDTGSRPESIMECK